MRGLFYNLKNFNEDISAWNTSKVEDMLSMFEDADNFNQALNNWDVSKVKTMKNMFISSSLEIENPNGKGIKNKKRKYSSIPFLAF